MIFISIILVLIARVSCEESVTIKVSPENPVGMIYGSIHFRFKDIPTDYELVKIQGDFGSLKGIPIFRDINRMLPKIVPYEGHVLYADIKEVILYNLNPDFNDAVLTFIFYSKATGNIFSFDTVLTILPEIEDFTFTTDLKIYGYPFKLIPTVNPSKKYVIKLRSYDNDETPVNYIAVMVLGRQQASLHAVEKYTGDKKFNGLYLKYDKDENTLSVSRKDNYNELLNVQIMLVRKYEKIFQVYTTGLISLQNFYENFDIDDQIVSWDILEKYKNKISFQMFYYEGKINKGWTKGIDCTTTSDTCTVDSKASEIFENATLNSFTLKSCPSVREFVISFAVTLTESNVVGNTLEEYVEYTGVSAECQASINESSPNVDKEEAEEEEENEEDDEDKKNEEEKDENYVDVYAAITKVRTGVPVRKNVGSIRGMRYCYKDHENPQEFSNALFESDDEEMNEHIDIMKTKIEEGISDEVEYIYDEATEETDEEDQKPVKPTADSVLNTNSQVNSEASPPEITPAQRHVGLYDPVAKKEVICVGTLSHFTDEIYEEELLLMDTS